MERIRYLATCKLRAATLKHRAGQLLDKQWHPTGALNHGVNRFARQRISRRYLGYHIAHIACTEAIERNLRMMGPQRPWRVKLGARRAQQQQVRRWPLLDEQLNYF